MSEQRPAAESSIDIYSKAAAAAVKIVNMSRILGSEDVHQICQDNDFAGSIQDLVVHSWLQQSQPYDDNYEAVAGTEDFLTIVAEISLDAELHPDIWDRFILGRLSDPSTAKATGFETIAAMTPDAVVLTAEDNLQFIVWYDIEKRQITLSNNLELYSDGTLEDGYENVSPVPLSVLDAEVQLAAFSRALLSVAQLADSVGDDEVYPLNKTIILGEKISVVGALCPYRVTSIPKLPSRDLGQRQYRLHLEQPDQTADGLDSIEGYRTVRPFMHDIANHLQISDIAQKPKGLFLYGPSGTGKTTLAKALAAETQSLYLPLNSTTFLAATPGVTEKNCHEFFNFVRDIPYPLILHFEHFDRLFDESFSPMKPAERASLASAIRSELDSMIITNPATFVIAESTDVNTLPLAILTSQRFDRHCRIGLPDVESRQLLLAREVWKTMLKYETGSQPAYADDLHIPYLADRSDGLSGKDITQIFNYIDAVLGVKARNHTVPLAFNQQALLATIAASLTQKRNR